MKALPKTQKQLALEAELKQLRKRFNTICKLASAEGFYLEWFNSLPKYKSQREAFEVLNDKYYNAMIPPVYRYSSYQAFKNYVSRRNKNDNKIQKKKSNKAV